MVGHDNTTKRVYLVRYVKNFVNMFRCLKKGGKLQTSLSFRVR